MIGRRTQLERVRGERDMRSGYEQQLFAVYIYGRNEPLTFCKSSANPPMFDLPVREYEAADCLPTTLGPIRGGRVYKLGDGVLLFWAYLVREPNE